MYHLVFLCVCVCSDMCSLAEAMLLELPGLDGHCALPQSGDDDGCRLPGLHLCRCVEASEAADCAAPPDAGPCCVLEGQFVIVAVSTL